LPKRKNLQKALESAVRCFQAGDLGAAARHCDTVLQAVPGESNALHVLGAVRLRQNDPQTAIRLLEQASKAEPKNPEIMINLGAAYRAGEQPIKAAEVLHDAVRRVPNNPSAHLNLANALVAADNGPAAIKSYRQVLTLVPGHSSALTGLARTLHMTGDIDAAIAEYENLDALAPDVPETLNALGALHASQNRLEIAEAYFRRALGGAPNDFDVAANLGNVLAKTFRTDEALTLYSGALAATPDDPDLLCNVGNAVSHRGDHEGAARHYRRALEIDRDHVDAHAGLANNLLADGNYTEGWEHFLKRTSTIAMADQLDRTPFTDNLHGQRLFVLADQGLGDQIFFARFLPALRERGAHVTYRPDPRIADMMRRAGVADEITDQDAPTKGDRIVSVGDLPYLLGHSDGDALPPHFDIPALPDRESVLRDTLAEFGPAPWVGVTWRAGTPNLRQALLKEAPAALFASALRDIPGSVVVVQRNPAEGEIGRFETALGRRVLDLSHTNADIEDLLALSGLLDSYAGVSNTKTHLRAARGKLSDVIMPSPAEFRWMNEGDASPWFPGCRVFRQSADGAWPPAFERLSMLL
jgi:tetratricopeptide (TPR) repeat protein